MNTIDLTKLTHSAALRGEDDNEIQLLKAMLSDAERYLLSFGWCRDIIESYIGIGVGGVVAVFLFQITPNGKLVDEWLWVIVGDIPPAYITIDSAPNSACALDAYIGAMQKWINAVSNGHPVDGLIRVNVSPSLENVGRLKSRLDFLDKQILSRYSDDLKD
jgi:hypothetical protein